MWFGFQQPFVGGTLRDATKNGCVGDYHCSFSGEFELQISSKALIPRG